MSKLNLKDNIWIEGFTRKELFNLSKEDWRDIVDDVSVDKMLYSGKTSEIPEEILQQVVNSSVCINTVDNLVRYADYSSNTIILKSRGKLTKVSKSFSSAKESIQSACNKEYCMIYKTN